MGLHVKDGAEGQRRTSEVWSAGEVAEVCSDGIVRGGGDELTPVIKAVSFHRRGAAAAAVMQCGEEDYNEQNKHQTVCKF